MYSEQPISLYRKEWVSPKKGEREDVKEQHEEEIRIKMSMFNSTCDMEGKRYLLAKSGKMLLFLLFPHLFQYVIFLFINVD